MFYAIVLIFYSYIHHKHIIHCYYFCFRHLSSRARCSSWAKSSPSPVFRNKVLLDHSHAHSFTYFTLTTTELGRRNRQYGSQSLKYLVSSPIYIKSLLFLQKKIKIFSISNGLCVDLSCADHLSA